MTVNTELQEYMERQRKMNFADGWHITTFTGKNFYWDRIAENEYDIRDIAHALANNCRWTGHVKKFYSVAQHSVLMSYEVSLAEALEALLHDGTEAYVHDVPSPLKAWLKEHGFTAFSDLEHAIGAAINRTFGLDYPYSAAVKVVDRRMLETEYRDLMPHRADHKPFGEPFKWKIKPLLPEQAERVFLDRFHELVSAKHMGVWS